MSNIPDLKNYFLNDQYIKDCKGDENEYKYIKDGISQSFADLIKYLWTPDNQKINLAYDLKVN